MEERRGGGGGGFFNARFTTHRRRRLPASLNYFTRIPARRDHGRGGKKHPVYSVREPTAKIRSLLLSLIRV